MLYRNNTCMISFLFFAIFVRYVSSSLILIIFLFNASSNALVSMSDTFAVDTRVGRGTAAAAAADAGDADAAADAPA